jgi:prepilin-type N-terminal cleavage/methylation domain-containing protein
MILPIPLQTRIRRGIRSGPENTAPRSNRAFTLVELLTVIAIIATVTAFSIPAVTSLSKSSARQTAASLVLSAFDQTRSLALAQSGTFYLVFADKNMAIPNQPSALGQPYSYRSFAIFQESYNATFQKYERFAVTGWTTLPAGVAFKPDIANSDTIYSAPLNETFFAKPVGQEVQLPCFKFNSLGALDEPATASLAQIRIFEGFVDPTGAITETNPALTEAEEVISVSLVTGRAKRLVQ